MAARLIPLFAAAAWLLGGGAASAQSATAVSDVNVRSGPGTEYAVIDQLPAGEVVRILDCRGEWCEISMGGDSGYVARSYLDDGGGRRTSVRVYSEDDYGGGPFVIERDDPEEVYGLSIGGYYESRPYYYRGGYYYWGGRWYSRRPGVTGWRETWRRGGRDRPGDAREGRTNRPPRAEERFRPMERARVDRDGPGDTRDGRTNRPPRVEERRIPSERERAGRDDRFERGGREGGSTVSVDPRGREGAGRSEPRREPIEPRAGREEGRTVASPVERRGPSDGGGRTPGGGGSSDRGDRIGLDRAGGGGGGGGGTGRGDR